MKLHAFDLYIERIAGITARCDAVMCRTIDEARGEKQVKLIHNWLTAYLDNLCVAQDLAVWRGACVALDGAR